MRAEWIEGHCTRCVHGRVVGRLDGGFRAATCHWERHRQSVDARRRERYGTPIEMLAECPDRVRVARDEGMV
jgi:hypothetical protein